MSAIVPELEGLCWDGGVIDLPGKRLDDDCTGSDASLDRDTGRRTSNGCLRRLGSFPTVKWKGEADGV